MAPFERALVTSYRLSVVSFPLSLRVSEILPDPPTSQQTDANGRTVVSCCGKIKLLLLQTDDMQSQYRAMHIVHRAVKMTKT